MLIISPKTYINFKIPFNPHFLLFDDINTQHIIGNRNSIVVPTNPPSPVTQSETSCFRIMRESMTAINYAIELLMEPE